MIRHICTSLSVAAMVALPVTAQGAFRHHPDTVFDFETSHKGDAPPGFTSTMTNEGGAPHWTTQEIPDAPSGKMVVAQISDDKTRKRFPLLVYDGVDARNLDLSVKFKLISGTVDQAAGLIWRYADKNNYYLLRANGLEDNVVLYKVLDGKRSSIAPKGTPSDTYGMKIRVTGAHWHDLRVVAQGKTFSVYYDGKKLYDVEDEAFSHAGKAGLWTKADSVTLFDDLAVKALPD